MKNRINKIIGRLEHVGLSEFGLDDITAKIDTGAYTSSLHCYDVNEIKGDSPRLEFLLLDPEHPDFKNKKLVFKNYSKKRVKSSNGQSEYRYKIHTQIKIGHDVFITDFTLTDRSEMKYPILIGRKTLNKRYLVDPSKSYLQNI